MNEESIARQASSLASPEARLEFLEHVCGGDTTLRQRVDQLLSRIVSETPPQTEQMTDGAVREDGSASNKSNSTAADGGTMDLETPLDLPVARRLPNTGKSTGTSTHDDGDHTLTVDSERPPSVADSQPARDSSIGEFQSNANSDYRIDGEIVRGGMTRCGFWAGEQNSRSLPSTCLDRISCSPVTLGNGRRVERVVRIQTRRARKSHGRADSVLSVRFTMAGNCTLQLAQVCRTFVARFRQAFNQHA